MPVGVGSFTNPRADEDNDYFTKGHDKYYTLFINKTDGSRLNQEELDFITALLNEGKYSYDEESNRFYEWGGTPEYGIGGWIGGTLIGGFLGYQVGKAVGYGRAVQGYEGGGDIPEGYHQMPDGTIMPDSAHYGLGGLLLAGGFGAYVGYKIGRAKPKKTGFGTEKKIARKVKSKAKELTSKKKFADGGNVVAYKYYDKDDYDDSVTIIKPDELQAFLDDWNNTMETNYKTAKEFNSSEDYYVIEEIYYGGGETITKPKPRITPTETPTKPDKGNPYAPKVKPFPKADYLISNK
jgi:hypothetical protein